MVGSWEVWDGKGERSEVGHRCQWQGGVGVWGEKCISDTDALKQIMVIKT